MTLQQSTLVTIGVDTHRDTHTAAAIDHVGRQLGVIEFDTTAAGNRQFRDWVEQHGPTNKVGIEGTSSYGASLTRFLTKSGFTIIEVNRPNRQHRRRHGKSDPADAYGAAKAVLSGEATSLPKNTTGDVEALRVLHMTRRSAVKDRTRAGNQIKDLVVTAPDEIREMLRGLTTKQRVRKAAAWRPRTTSSINDATKHAILLLAKRWTYLDNEVKQTEQMIWPILNRLCPILLVENGVGLDAAAKLMITAGQNPDRLKSEASFAALCGTSPIDMSSGRHHHHRLNRGGNRQANNALHTVMLTRLRTCEETRTYMANLRAKGKTYKAATRIIKRAIARRLHHAIVKDLLT